MRRSQHFLVLIISSIPAWELEISRGLRRHQPRSSRWSQLLINQTCFKIKSMIGSRMEKSRAKIKMAKISFATNTRLATYYCSAAIRSSASFLTRFTSSCTSMLCSLIDFGSPCVFPAVCSFAARARPSSLLLVTALSWPLVF